MGKIIEGLWDCPFCGNKRIRAGQKTCPDCGHPQDENTKFYMPDEIKYVSEEEAEKISRNPDWQCSFCGSLNSDDLNVCKNCGATKEDSERNYFEMRQQEEEKKRKKEEKKRILPEKYLPKYTKEKATVEAGAAHSGNFRSNHFWHDVMPGTEDVEKPVYRKEPVYATKYYYEIDKWTVVDTAKSSGNDQNPSWPEPKLKDGQRTGAEEEHYFVTATYEKKKGKTETGRYEMDLSQWKELKKGAKIELKIDAAGFAEINQK